MHTTLFARSGPHIPEGYYSFRIDCAHSYYGPWHTIETIVWNKLVPIIHRAAGYRGQHSMGSVITRVVRNGNVEEATILPRRWEERPYW